MIRRLLSGAIAILLLGVPVVAWLRTDVLDPSFPLFPPAATTADRRVIRAVLEHAACLVPLGLTPPPPPATGRLSRETLASLNGRLTVLVSATTTSPPELDAPDRRNPEALAVRAMRRRNFESGPTPLRSLPLPSYLSFTKLDDSLPTGGAVVAILSFSLPGYAADIAAVHVDIFHRGPVPDPGGGGILFILQRRGATWYVIRQEGTWIA